MIRKSKKALCAGLMVILVTAVATSGAAAAEFHTEKAGTELVGTQATKMVISLGGMSVECSTGSYTGTMESSTSSDITLDPSYGSCAAFGFATAHVNETTCKIRVVASTPILTYTSCSASGIDITPTFLGASVCTITLLPGTANYDVDVEGTGSGSQRDLDIVSTESGMAYQEHGTACGVGSGFATKSGTVTVKGFKDGAQVGIRIS